MALTRIKTDQVLDGTITNDDLASDIALNTSGNITTSGDISAANVTLTGELNGPATFYIDPAPHDPDTDGATNGLVVIRGDLQVDGTTTTVNSTTMDVADLNITLASGAANAAAADGAGLTVDGASATILYDSSDDLWQFNKGVRSAVGLTVATAAPSIVLMDANGTYNHKFRLNGSNSLILERYNGTSTLSTLKLDETGDVGFYENNGGTPQVGMHWDYADGRLGIGTDSPNYPLHISGTGSQRLRIQKTDAGGDADLQLYSPSDSTQWILFGDSTSGNNSGVIKYVHSTNKMHFRTNDVDDRLVIADDGNIGVETNDPIQKLDVRGSISLSNTGTASRFIGFYSNVVDSSTNDLSAFIEKSGNNFTIYNDDAGDLQISNNAATAIRINSTNKVGIGPNVDASSTLHVKNTGGANTAIIERAVGSNAANLNEFSSYYSLSLKNRSDGSYLNFGGNSSRTDIQATDGANPASSKAIHLNPFGGNVGIGTGATAPAAKFNVTGSASGNWISIIENTHNSNGNGLKVLAGDDADTVSFRVSTYNNSTLFDVRSDGDVTATGAYNTSHVRHSIRPTLNLDFANSKQLDPRITFYRDSIATYYDSKGIIRYANTNEPRFDHEPDTGESKGLLIEEDRTNIFNYTNNPEKWPLMSAGSSDPIVNSVLSPDGTMNATKLIVTGGDPYFYQNGLTLNGTYTFSFWIKAFGSTVGKHYTVRGANIGTSFSIAPSGGLPSEWTRITHTFTSGSTTTAYVGIEAPDNSPANGDELSIWGAQLELGSFASSLIPSDDKFTSRSSEATYYDENGILRTAPANSPRYGYKYDGRKWVETGLILEGAASNLTANFLNPQSTTPYWSTNQNLVPEAAPTIKSPDGSYTTVKAVLNNTGNVGHSIYKTNTGTANSQRCMSVYAKAAEYDRIYMYFDGTTPTIGGVYYDLANGVVSGGPTQAFDAYGMEDVGDGWWRCWFSGTVTGGQAVYYWHIDVTAQGSNTNQHSGAVGQGVYLWGPQAEYGAVPTSYIYTVGSTETRSADVSSSAAYTRERDYAESQNVDSLLPDVNQSNIDFTLYGDLQGIAHNAGFQQAIYLEDTSDSGNMYVTLFSAYNGNNTIASSYNINGVARNFGNWTSTASDIALRWKIALGIEENNSRAAANGVLGSSAAGYWNGGGTFDRFYIGNGYQGGRPFNGWIRKITYYDKRLSNDEITALTENN